MAKIKSLAQQIAELDEPVPRDYDPEENEAAHGSEEGSDSAESEDENIGTEHYETVGKSKLRKPDEVALGPQYAGSRVSRAALLDGDDHEPSSDYEDALETQRFADPDALDLDIDDDDDGDIDSDEALGEGDDEKFKDFAFRGSGKPRDIKATKGKRPTAADFISSDDEDMEGGADLKESLADLAIEVSDEEVDSDNDGMHSEASEIGQDSEDADGAEPDDDDSGLEEDSEDARMEHEMLDVDNESKDSGSNASEPELEDDEDEDEDEDESMDGEDEAADEESSRAELRKIMGEQQKSVVATISEAVKADVEKGVAVKQQRKAFDTLLNVRIRLQKGLIASNSISTIDSAASNDGSQPYEAAEAAAIKLLNSLNNMRAQLEKAGGAKTGSKRKREISLETPISTIWQNLQKSEALAINNRRGVLDKWSTRVRTTSATPLSRKLNSTAPQQTITAVLEDQLSNPERLIKRTKVPRSCAPIQAKAKMIEDHNIYDDADFYQLLLKELIDQRMAETSSSVTAIAAANGERPIAQWTAVKEAKTKRNVDTKASKGRKMKFTVHEKLQNFMAPEDRGSWEVDAVDRFFGTLLGQKATLDEVDERVSDDGEGPLQEEALMLFRS